MEHPENQPTVIAGAQYRFTVLTEQLIRMEYSPDGVFEDRPTSMVQSRSFPPVQCRVFRTDRGIQLRTACINLYYDEKPFSPGGLWAENRSPCPGIFTTWHYGDPLQENLGGTGRTLDNVDGEMELEPGIASRMNGYSVLEDSRSPVLTGDGWFEGRKDGIKDLYLFCYGTDYKKAVRDYFRLCGQTPLLPRFALGNWWSRYYAYSGQEYLELMDRFRAKGIPLSTAVIDMDWHITKTGPEEKGWTGYTWNRELFPDPEGFLEELHRRGMKVTLNLHPAEGIQAHEACYSEAARRLGIDEKAHQRIPFEVTDRKFMEVYFDCALRPLEEQGVDFWWVDWQQGTQSAVPGVDPLWVLNHYHTLHAARDGKRPLILSRYGGPGSHRYPIGFSGDTVISWDSLRFQPYFTSTAANIGYGWWSHDIGGHMFGSRDPELQVRWLQFGAFSPILRMHSTNNRFNGKEPWNYAPEIERMMTEILRLRHRLVPYLYTMNWRCHTQGDLLAEPMYYACPEREEAYRVPNQYRFGSELMVMPITDPQIGELELGKAVGWLPEGQYYDFFTGMRYSGDRMLSVFRPLDAIPVFAKAGAIVPLAGKEEMGTANPRELEIVVFAGADGRFDLYEDDGESFGYRQGACSITELEFRWNDGENCTFRLKPGQSGAYLPEKRTYRLRFVGIDGVKARVKVNGEIFTRWEQGNAAPGVEIRLPELPIDAQVEVLLEGKLSLAHNPVLECQEHILNAAHIAYRLKDRIFQVLASGRDSAEIYASLLVLKVPRDLIEALMEPVDGK